MMDSLATLASQNFLSPVILFFVLGLMSGFVKSDLEIPDSISKALAIYLIAAIGYKGGAALSDHSEDGVAGLLLLSAALSFILPFIAFFLLKIITSIDNMNASAVAAHYGSVSLVTFTAATTFLEMSGISYHGYMVAALAIMETPAIMAGLLMAAKFAQSKAFAERLPVLLREVFLNGTVVLLMGSFVIGVLANDTGSDGLQSFFYAPFTGVLCIFMLEMGILVAKRFDRIVNLGFSTIVFGIVMPLINGLIGFGAAHLLNLGPPEAMLLVVLCASVSYIAVPAAMRIALPKAEPSIYLTLSLGVTFPFNIVVGIPLYYWLVTIGL